MDRALTGSGLVELFDGLPLPAAGEMKALYETVALPGGAGARLGKDRAGTAAILLPASGDGASPPPVRLQNLRVEWNKPVIIQKPEGHDSSKFTVMNCSQPGAEYTKLFLHLFASVMPLIGDGPGGFSPEDLIRRLVELFRKTESPASRPLLGLWGELMVILTSPDPAALVDAWHSNPSEKHDFSLGDQRLEVKCAKGAERTHLFSMEQLQPPSGTAVYVATMLTDELTNGTSVLDLMEQISARGRLSASQAAKLSDVVAETLGAEWRGASRGMFDRNKASKSLVFVSASEVPCVPGPLPDGVTQVTFRADLSSCAPLSVPPVGSELMKAAMQGRQ